MTTNVIVITGSRTTDLNLPADLPIKEWIEAAVDKLRGRYQDDDIGFTFGSDSVWTLAPVGAPPIDRDESLDSADVADGDPVALVTVSHTERYRPLVEDNIDAVAVLNPQPRFQRADIARWLNLLTMVVAVGVAAAGVAGWSASPVSRIWWGPALVGTAVVLAVLARQIWRRYDEPAAAQSTVVAAVIIGVTGVGLAIPVPRESSWLGAPQLAAAGFGLLAAVAVVRGGPLRRNTVAAAAGSVGLITGLAATATAYGWHQWVWPAVAAAGLFTITNAAKLTVVFARIALPPVPAPGETVDVGDLLDPVVDIAAESANPAQGSWQAILDSVPSSSARLVERATLAQQLVAGFGAAGSAALAVGTVGVLQQGHFFPHTVALAILVIMAAMFRSRFYANRVCAWSLLTAAAAIVLGCATKMIYWHPANAPVVAAVVLSVMVVGMVGFAASRNVRRIGEVARHRLELLDGATVAITVVLLFWVAGVFNLLRNIIH